MPRHLPRHMHKHIRQQMETNMIMTDTSECSVAWNDDFWLMFVRGLMFLVLVKCWLMCSCMCPLICLDTSYCKNNLCVFFQVLWLSFVLLGFTGSFVVVVGVFAFFMLVPWPRHFCPPSPTQKIEDPFTLTRTNFGRQFLAHQLCTSCSSASQPTDARGAHVRTQCNGTHVWATPRKQ